MAHIAGEEKHSDVARRQSGGFCVVQPRFHRGKKIQQERAR